MREKEVINRLRKLRQIKPNRDWVIFTKTQILGESEKRDLTLFSIIPALRILFLKPAYTGLVFVFILKIGLFGTFILAQRSLPGDPLYFIKRITERTQAVFVPEEEKPQFSLELTNRRLEELTKVIEAGRVRNLAPAINEFQASVVKGAKNLAKIEPAGPEPVAVKRVIEAVGQANEIEERAKKIGEKVEEVKPLAMPIGEEELRKLEEATRKLELRALISVLENIISVLEDRILILTEKEKEILNQLKELVEEERYLEALELYLRNQ